MLRLDSSEMLPGSQKGEKTAEILKTHARLRHFDSRKCLQPVGTGNDHVTPRDVNRRASLPCACVKTVKHSKLHISRFSDGKLKLEYERPSTDSGFAPFVLILPNNPQYQLGR